jgi:hypothetical protein
METNAARSRRTGETLGGRQAAAWGAGRPATPRDVAFPAEDTGQHRAVRWRCRVRGAGRLRERPADVRDLMSAPAGVRAATVRGQQV